MRSNQLLPVRILGLAVLGAVFSGPLSPRCRAAEDPAVKRSAELAKPSSKPGDEKKTFPEWDKVVDGAKRLEGLFPLYYDEKQQKLDEETADEPAAFHGFASVNSTGNAPPFTFARVNARYSQTVGTKPKMRISIQKGNRTAMPIAVRTQPTPLEV